MPKSASVPPDVADPSRARTRRNSSSGAAVADRPRAGSKRGFLLEFIRRPAQIGSFTPSSKYLARRMVEVGGVSEPGSRVVVEYGPGTGPVTGHIRRALRPGAKFFAVEINPKFAQMVRAAHPGVHVYEGSAADIEQYCKSEGIATPERGGGIDVIVSGIPWASLPEMVQKPILEATVRMLKRGGRLVTFGYSFGLVTPAGQRFHKLLPSYFKTVERGPLEWRNLPPAFITRCVK